ncbi:MAG: hypothetical protein ACK4GU_12235 [Alishewanella aestuarii]
MVFNKHERTLLLLAVLVLLTHLIATIRASTPAAPQQARDAIQQVPQLQLQSFSPTNELMNKFSLLYEIEPAVANDQATEQVVVLETLKQMAPRLLAIDISSAAATVHLLVSKGENSERFSLTIGETLHGYQLQHATLSEVTFVSDDDSFTLRMFKSFEPVTRAENQVSNHD